MKYVKKYTFRLNVVVYATNGESESEAIEIFCDSPESWTFRPEDLELIGEEVVDTRVEYCNS